jgi:hypothetical protein
MLELREPGVMEVILISFVLFSMGFSTAIAWQIPGL